MRIKFAKTYINGYDLREWSHHDGLLFDGYIEIENHQIDH